MKRLTVFLLVSCSTPLFAEPISCTDKYDLYVDAQREWQTNSAARAEALLPAFSQRIQQYKTVQLSAIEHRSLAIKLTLQHFPDKVNTWGGLNNWVDLSPELLSQLGTIDPQLKKLKKAQEKAQTLASSHASENVNFQQVFRETVLADTTFRQLMQDFNTRSREINSSSCNK